MERIEMRGKRKENEDDIPQEKYGNPLPPSRGRSIIPPPDTPTKPAK
jgi:hypothetical protein